MASSPDPATATTSCSQWVTNAARLVATLRWSSAIRTRIPALAELFMPDTSLFRITSAKWPHAPPKSEQSYRRNRDSSPETDVDVCARGSVPQLIVPGEVEIARFFVAIVQGQGIGIERAPDDFRSLAPCGQHGEVHIIEKARLDRPGDDPQKSRKGTRAVGQVLTRNDLPK